MKRPTARALHGEWTKLRTVPGQLWTLLALPWTMTGCTVLVAAAAHPEESGTLDPTALSLSGVYLAQTLAVLVAVAVVSAEYPRTIRTTLLANPRRGQVFTAKTLLVAAAVAGVAVPAVTLSLAAGRWTLDGVPQLPPTSGELWRAAFGTAAYLLLTALLAAGIALIVRHAAAAVGVALTLLYGPYLAILIVKMPDHVLHTVQKASPMTAGLAVQTVLGTGTAPLSPGEGLAVLAGYAAAALAAGWGVLRLRDA
ncbi:hypothetical protein ABII15_18730 [Streptomyces sp. HUAS MG91]|uniref:ABC transporter permease n=1 Tax=Streptomyces tabacisoli TaxID=3156398 RepID=A0AAU8IUZ7_9ACTN